MATPADINATKREMRVAAAEGRRRALLSLPRSGEDLRFRFLTTIPTADHDAISAFWPLADELDTRPLIMALSARGHRIGLPVVVKKGQPLLFRLWAPGTELVQGNFRVMTPPPDAPELVPSLLIVPLLSFDRAGYRLGYGGGFYDRTLAKLRAAGGNILAVGVALSVQEVPSVPRDDTDQPLDWIVTEREAFAIG
ncbi:MAG TPA: 5-formyltetrahydrofolate cyclo-ligase [Verrucomicrobiae bacterium]|nr:5-formyltetrahydrofolate cyclo-ligase [Verrucomicrobiae bacterium]